MAPKRVRGSSSSSAREDRFRSPQEAAVYNELKSCRFTDPRPLDQSKISFPITQLFSQSTLLPLLTLNNAYHSEFLFEFFANLSVPADFSCVRSYFRGKEISITSEDLTTFLSLSSSGESAHLTIANTGLCWEPMNLVLRGTRSVYHDNFTNSLLPNARAVQHVLRTNVIPKGGDRIHVTPLLSIVTYFVMSNTSFSATDLIIRYISSLSVAGDRNFKRKPNLALGHLISYIIEAKYNLTYPSPPDHILTPMTDKSFHLYYGARSQGAQDGSSSNDELPGAAEPVVPPPPHDLTVRFDRIDAEIASLRSEVQGIPADTARQLGELRSWFETQHFFSSAGDAPDS